MPPSDLTRWIEPSRLSDVDMFGDPARRRLWLINKGLEHTCLAGALELARAVENFLQGACGEFAAATEALPEAHLAFVGHPGAPSISSQPEAENAAKSAQIVYLAGAPLNAHDPQVGDGMPSAALDAFVSVVDADGVVRYLRRFDDVVVSAGDGAFLVNGRFRETLEQLVERANTIRTRQRLPQFVLLPRGR
jgi:hypothetical protein